ncbi:MAG: hypothetical protein WD041_03060 [Nitriliruptoraceae bacterium]
MTNEPLDDLAGQRIPIGALTINESLWAALRCLQAVWRPSAVVALVLLGPYQLLASFLVSRQMPASSDGPVTGRFADPFVDRTAEQMATGMRLMGLLVIAGLVLSLMASATSVEMIRRVDRGGAADARASLRLGFEHLGPALGATVLMVVLAVSTVFGTAVLISPVAMVNPGVAAIMTTLAILGIGFAVAVLGQVLVPVVVFDGTGPLGTLRRGLHVLRRRTTRAAMLTVAAAVAILTSGLLVSVVAALVAPSGGWLVEALVAVALSMVAVPITAVTGTLMHVDAASRLQGMDPRRSTAE